VDEVEWDLDVVVTHLDGKACLAIRGEIDIGTREHLALAIGDALKTSSQEVEIDMSGVTFMGSDGIAILISSRRLADDLGKVFRVVAASSHVERTLRAVGLTDFLSSD
jgi:anti-sigma B factor antagonist